MDPRELAQLLPDWAAGDGALYARLAGALADLIERGSLPPGRRLPPERLLAATLAVSRTTVAGAYGRLRDAGLVSSRQGSGTMVLARPALPPGPREFALAVTLDRNAIFRGLIDPGPDAIDLRPAYVVGTEDVPDAVFDSVGQDLAGIRDSHGYMPAGFPALREAVAARYADRGVPTHPDQVLITTGAQQAISLIAQLFVEPGDHVALEALTHPGAIDAFAGAGAHLDAVPVDDGGMDVAALAERLVARPRLAYAIPSAHNPTGATMPVHRRRELGQLLDATGSWLIEDETLADLVEGGAPVPVAAHAETVLAVGSVSKVAWGGLRLGWVRGPATTIRRLAQVKAVADCGSPLVTQLMGLRVLEAIGSIAPARRRRLSARRTALLGALATSLPDWALVGPGLGLTLWLRLPEGNAVELAQVAARHGVVIAPGSVCAAARGHTDHVRLPFGLPEADLVAAVDRLAAAWEDYLGLLGRAEPALAV